ncbi:MAG: hypothetical protein ACOCUR_00305 [Nanoarchaeota archaeon]
MNDEEFMLYTNLLNRKHILNDRPFFTFKGVFESHHYLGKVNSDKAVYIHKQRHDFITNRTNFLSRSLRQQPSIAYLTNVIGGLELLAFELEHVLFRLRKNPSWKTFEEQLSLRGFSINQITIIMKKIMEMMQYEKRHSID